MVPDINSNRQIFFCHLGSFFALLLLSQPGKRKFQKNFKTPEDMILHNCAKNLIIDYTVPEIWHVTDVTVIFDSALFFDLLLPLPNSLRNENI